MPFYLWINCDYAKRGKEPVSNSPSMMLQPYVNVQPPSRFGFTSDPEIFFAATLQPCSRNF